MNRIVSNRSWLAGLLAALVMLGCATTPQPNPTLEEARERVSMLADDAEVNRLAAVELRDAREHLQRAESIWQDRGDTAVVEHHARLAKRQADIAMEATNARRADQRVDQLRSEREQLRLQARASRAEQAAARDRSERERAEAARMAEAQERRRAEERQREAELARQAADEARQLADEARQLAEQRARELERQSEQMRAEAERLQQQLAELEARPTDRGLVLTLGSDVLFDVDSYEVKSGARRTLERIGEFLNEYPERQVLIEGFTDSTGTREYNLGLSERRAKSVRDALVGMDVEAERIEIRGFGPDHPVASNDTSSGRQLNRRVEVIISDDQEAVPDRAE